MSSQHCAFPLIHGGAGHDCCRTLAYKCCMSMQTLQLTALAKSNGESKAAAGGAAAPRRPGGWLPPRCPKPLPNAGACDAGWEPPKLPAGCPKAPPPAAWLYDMPIPDAAAAPPGFDIDAGRPNPEPKVPPAEPPKAAPPPPPPMPLAAWPKGLLVATLLPEALPPPVVPPNPAALTAVPAPPKSP